MLAGEDRKKNKIEGTMVALENATGYITALVGGSEYGQDNQFIRAVQAKLQPGSSFKPLYYTAAIDSRKFTPTTVVYDVPTIFKKEDGTLYIPQNNKGEWYGAVQLWYALTKSMNIPSLKILQGIGFDAAINQAAALLGVNESEFSERKFERVYPFGLGVCSVRPIEMAKAFATLAPCVSPDASPAENIIFMLTPHPALLRRRLRYLIHLLFAILLLVPQKSSALLP